MLLTKLKLYLETTIFNLTALVNSREGYKGIDIYSPSEVVENDEVTIRYLPDLPRYFTVKLNA